MPKSIATTVDVSVNSTTTSTFSDPFCLCRSNKLIVFFGDNPSVTIGLSLTLAPGKIKMRFAQIPSYAQGSITLQAPKKQVCPHIRL